MNSKFYVSLDAARLLKEKGYDKVIEDFDFVYLKDGSLSPRVFLHTSPFISAPTKAEAIDWLESKGMCIIVFRRTIDNKVEWRYVVLGQTEFISGFKTRLEAEDAAIIKALRLL